MQTHTADLILAVQPAPPGQTESSHATLNKALMQ